MGFHSIRFYQFRNLENALWTCSGKEIFLVGENGQGKTNVVEGVYCLSYGTSFRAKKEENLIRTGEKECLVEGVFSKEGDTLIQVRFLLEEGQKRIRVDGKEIRDRSELVGKIPSILFVPEDTQFIVGPPERQRHFFNQTSVLTDPLFLSLWNRYGKLLKQRNFALKQGQQEVLPAFDQEYARLGIEITLARKRIVETFGEVFSTIFGEVSQLPIPVSIEYLPSWKYEEPKEVLRVLQESRERDLRLGTSTSGPHRDRFRFYFGEGEFSTTASNGQIRLASLVLKTAQALFYTEKTGCRPILLLDDVLLEMDHPRRKRFFSCLPLYDQAFFTFLPDEPYQTYLKPTTRVYTVEKGVLKADG
ncbi:MAG: DNA replication and repair protein RecF [Spirochaetes bacterium]|nr:DNA replication and repair protein RecF [Spirochaetota bacterium]